MEGSNMNSFVNFGQTAGFGIPGRDNDRDGKSREVFLNNGMTVRAEARDPYGHWYVVWGKGPTPDILSGAYTSAEQAVQAINIWASNHTFATKVVDEKVSIPELKRKSDK
jgi:hypothetical protein